MCVQQISHLCFAFTPTISKSNGYECIVTTATPEVTMVIFIVEEL